MNDPISLKKVKEVVNNNNDKLSIIFHSVKMNRIGKEYKQKADLLMTPSSLHQTDKYFKRLFYNKIF